MKQMDLNMQDNTIGDLPVMDTLRDDYTKALAHDVRNPLHTMMIYTECMMDNLYGDLTDEQSEAVQEIATAAKLMTVLVNNVFAMEQWRRGEMAPCQSDFDLVNITKGVVEVAFAKAETLKVDIKMCAQEEFVSVRADRDMTQQMIHNVLSALVRSTEGSELIVSVQQRGMDAVIAITDPVMVLTAEEMQAVTEDPSHHKGGRFGGRILGLAMAKAFCECQRGTFRVVSDNGTRFEMSIPK